MEATKDSTGWPKRLVIAIAASTGISLLLALFWEKGFHPCFFYWRPDEYPRLAILWIAVFLVFCAPRTSGRGVVVAVVVFVYFVWPRGELAFLGMSGNLGAVAQLRNVRTALDEYHRLHNVFPASMPKGEDNAYGRRYYDFDYVPVRDISGAVTDYEVRAYPKPRTRSCHCTTSYTITSDRQIYFTNDNRPATTKDHSGEF